MKNRFYSDIFTLQQTLFRSLSLLELRFPTKIHTIKMRPMIEWFLQYVRTPVCTSPYGCDVIRIAVCTCCRKRFLFLLEFGVLSNKKLLRYWIHFIGKIPHFSNRQLSTATPQTSFRKCENPMQLCTVLEQCH